MEIFQCDLHSPNPKYCGQCCKSCCFLKLQKCFYLLAGRDELMTHSGGLENSPYFFSRYWDDILFTSFLKFYRWICRRKLPFLVTFWTMSHAFTLSSPERRLSSPSLFFFTQPGTGEMYWALDPVSSWFWKSCSSSIRFFEFEKRAPRATAASCFFKGHFFPLGFPALQKVSSLEELGKASTYPLYWICHHGSWPIYRAFFSI